MSDRVIKIEPTSAIAAARQGGQISASRVGSTINSSGPPRAVFETVGVFPYLFDIVPELSGGRVLSLTAEADKSAMLTLTTSYLASDPAEVTQVPGLTTGGSFVTGGTLYERAHTMLVQFGAGDVRHAFEIDAAEGSSCNVPGHHVDVTLLDYTFDRVQVAIPASEAARQRSAHTALRSFASVAAGTNIIPARVTQKVYCPFQVAVDMADPPNIGDFLTDLVNAFGGGTILFQGP